jgi:hypothetical protein
MTLLTILAMRYAATGQLDFSQHELSRNWFILPLIFLSAYYVAFIVIGIPYFLILKNKQYLSVQHFLFHGFIAGVVVVIVMVLMSLLRDGSLNTSLMKFLYVSFIFGLFGSIGACVLWLIAFAIPNKMLKSGTQQSGAP